LVHVDYLIAKVMELGIKDLGFEIRDWEGLEVWRLKI
jgi:hypothetical protein